MTTILDKVFGTYLGIEFKTESIVITYLKNAFSGITLLSSSTFPLTYGESPTDEVREYVSRHTMNIHKVFVSIPDRWAITKFIDIPTIKGKSAGVLANLMKFEIERHIPFEIDDVASDFMVIDEKDKNSSVVFVAVQQEKIDFVKEYLGKLTISPHAITISSFAVLNAIELGGVSAGGWQDIIGIVRRSDALGKQGEVNISIHIENTNAILAVIKDGLCFHLRSISCDMYETLEDFLIEMSKHLADFQSSLSIDHYDKLIIAGDGSDNPELREELNKKISDGIIHVNRVVNFSGTLKGEEMNGLSPSIGACFGGLGIGTYRINLLPHKTDYEIRKIAPLAAKVFLVIIVILLVAILSTETLKQKQYLADMEEAFQQNEPEVKELEMLLAEINALRAKSDLLDGVKESEVTLEILSELSSLIPSTSWVTNLDFKGIDLKDKKKTGSELIINGYADASSSLIPLLEDSPIFEKVEFVGPIKKTRDKEQFKLSAKIVRPAGREAKTNETSD